MTHINLIARIQTTADTHHVVKNLLESYAHHVREEPGNLRFELYSAADGGDVLVIERYIDQAAFDAHLNTPSNEAFNAALSKALDGAGSSLEMLTAI
ncbi:antibiotic biosynthesis monooxygenase [Rathayibacter festucae]|uniref:putative quinol monooxygenase n=1 Tax=Rathayibacter festucae TaxID=110937 RepID=UPI001FB51BB4|nr:antibiotic biosynthesis monooxygenase [Rathayibacter festucae]MCJ1702108.1 antibiotic biosynthesis monooxygenase [Rathayibacter festucae]